MFAKESLLSGIKKSPKIMVVDDNPTNILLISRILKAYGYDNIRGISDSALVLDQYKQWQPDIILLDLLMPRFNGLDILDQINSIRNRQYLPVIMITADNSMDNRLEALRLGANDYLSKPFNAQELIARVENLIRVKESMDQAMATETAFLQAQIRPHFLYNTLNTISSFCDTDPGKASRLIDDFAEYLRQSFDLKSLEFFVPIERELDLVRAYVRIQQARFGERVIFEIMVAESMDFSIPPLCIQPLVENALQHGLKQRDVITVQLLFAQLPDGVLITVKDNGSGIAQEKLKDILLRSEKKGIGLWNIDTRLKKYYGRGLTVKSNTNSGTEISFSVPPKGEA